MTAIVNEELLDERLAKLEMARAWSPRLVSKLESYVRSADDEALFRINPFSLARERNLPEDEVIDLLLNVERRFVADLAHAAVIVVVELFEAAEALDDASAFRTDQ